MYECKRCQAKLNMKGKCARLWGLCGKCNILERHNNFAAFQMQRAEEQAELDRKLQEFKAAHPTENATERYRVGALLAGYKVSQRAVSGFISTWVPDLGWHAQFWRQRNGDASIRFVRPNGTRLHVQSVCEGNLVAEA